MCSLPLTTSVVANTIPPNTFLHIYAQHMSSTCPPPCLQPNRFWFPQRLHGFQNTHDESPPCRCLFNILPQHTNCPHAALQAHSCTDHQPHHSNSNSIHFFPPHSSPSTHTRWPIFVYTCNAHILKGLFSIATFDVEVTIATTRLGTFDMGWGCSNGNNIVKSNVMYSVMDSISTRFNLDSLCITIPHFGLPPFVIKNHCCTYKGNTNGSTLALGASSLKFTTGKASLSFFAICATINTHIVAYPCTLD